MKIYTTFFLVVIAQLAYAQQEQAHRRRKINNENYVGLREFDPVSYFKTKPLKGQAKFQYDHKGIVYYFANEANREEFKLDPARFEPQYGGWCAYTMATTGVREKVQPASYKIIDGKLYLFYNFSGDNRLQKWMEGNEASLRTAADRKWKSGLR